MNKLKLANTAVEPIKPAQLDWQNESSPLSREFGDIYFSPENGPAEAEHVFISGNRLEQRWRQLEKEVFVIAETGFGTGLNFLLAWRLWLDSAPEHARLVYASIEKHPLCKEDLGRAAQAWPELTDYYNELLDQYPPLTRGLHTIDLANGRVRLLLYLDDISRALAELPDCELAPFSSRVGPKVDAWFLDGFAPGKNPDMWSAAVFKHISMLSKQGTTLATFTVAGAVRRGLSEAGFTISKVPGYGRKREMLTAGFSASPQFEGSSSSQTPWHVTAVSGDEYSEKHAIVIGAGLAGCHSANALAMRGWRVTLLERQREVATQASGNPQGALFTKLSHQHAPLTDFALSSLLYGCRFYRAMLASNQLESSDAQFCGMIQLAKNRDEVSNLNRLSDCYNSHHDAFIRYVSPEVASEISGVELDKPGLYFPGSGWIKPAAVCRALVNHPAIEVTCETDVITLNRQANNCWQLLDSRGVSIATAPVVVIANNIDARALEPTNTLPIKPVRGQISYLPSTGVSKSLKTIICQEGYLTPASAGSHCLGASFEQGNEATALSADAHRQNLDNLSAMVPELAANWQSLLPPVDELGGRVAFRGVTPDYLPMVGAVPDRNRVLETYAPLARNARQPVPALCPSLPGLYVNIGHGGRGTTYTPLAADLLACLVNKEPRPLPQTLWRALSPCRFLVRDIIRNKVDSP
jgi:tRNA 5-methylaminomethyl-2-thiouridine biosynthesis bifunctional protein